MRRWMLRPSIDHTSRYIGLILLFGLVVEETLGFIQSSDEAFSVARSSLISSACLVAGSERTPYQHTNDFVSCTSLRENSNSLSAISL